MKTKTPPIKHQKQALPRTNNSLRLAKSKNFSKSQPIQNITTEILWDKSVADKEVHDELERQYLELLESYRAKHYVPGQIPSIIKDKEEKRKALRKANKSQKKKSIVIRPKSKPQQPQEEIVPVISKKDDEFVLQTYKKTFINPNSGEKHEKKFKIILTPERVEEVIEYSEDEFNDPISKKTHKRWIRSKRNNFTEEQILDSSNGKAKTIRKKIRQDENGNDIEIEYSEDSFDDYKVGRHRRVWHRRDVTPAKYITTPSGTIHKRNYRYDENLDRQVIVEYSDEGDSDSKEHSPVWRRIDNRAIVEDFGIDEDDNVYKIIRKINATNPNESLEYSEDEEGEWRRRQAVKCIQQRYMDSRRKCHNIMKKYRIDGTLDEYSDEEIVDEDTGKTAHIWRKRQTYRIRQVIDPETHEIKEIKSRIDEDIEYSEEEVMDKKTDTMVKRWRRTTKKYLDAPKQSVGKSNDQISDESSPHDEECSDTIFDHKHRRKHSNQSSQYDDTEEISSKHKRTHRPDGNHKKESHSLNKKAQLDDSADSYDSSDKGTQSKESLDSNDEKCEKRAHTKLVTESRTQISKEGMIDQSSNDSYTEAGQLISPSKIYPKMKEVDLIEASHYRVVASDDEENEDDRFIILVSTGGEDPRYTPILKRKHPEAKQVRHVAIQVDQFQLMKPKETFSALCTPKRSTTKKSPGSLKLSPQQMRERFSESPSSPTREVLYYNQKKSSRPTLTKEEFDQMTRDNMIKHEEMPTGNVNISLIRANLVMKQ